jgi:tellurite resistance protein
MSTIGPHQALIYLMVTMAAVDGRMGEAEMNRIGAIVKRYPVFRGFEPQRLVGIAQEAGELLSIDGDEGLRTLLALVKEGLSVRLRETAYALAVEIAAADMKLPDVEIRLLQIIRDTLGLDKLACAAMERSAMARYALA